MQTWRRTSAPPADSSNPVVCINEYGGRGVFPAPAAVAATDACAGIGWQVEE